MSETKITGAADALDVLKSVPDIRSRALLVLLSLTSMVAPVASAGTFGLNGSLSLTDMAGSLTYLVPVAAIAVLAAPVAAFAKPYVRLLDLATGVIAAIVAAILLYNFLSVFSELSQSIGGVRFSSVASFSPSWGVVVFAGFVWLAIQRAMKALKSKPVTH